MALTKGTGYTLEELQKMGGKPVVPGQGYTKDQLLQMGGKNVDPREQMLQQQKTQDAQPKHGNFLSDVGNALGNFFGGNVIGDAIGSRIAEHSSGAQAVRNAPIITHNGKEIVAAGGNKDVVQHPTSKQIVGDVLKSAGSIGMAALPGAGSLGGKVAEGAAIGYGSDVAQKLIDKKDKVFKPGLGTVVGAAIPAVAGGLGAILKKTLGATTQVGDKVIQRAIDNPQAVDEAVKKYAQTPELKQSIVDRAEQAMNNFVNERNQEFGKGISKMTATAPLQKQRVLDSFAQEVDKFGGQVKEGGVIFNDTKLTKEEQNGIKKVFSVLKSWKDVTPTGFETLRQRISNEMKAFKFNNNDLPNVILGNVKKDLTAHISENVPGYADLLKNYGSKSETVGNVLSELRLNSSAKPSAKLNTIMKIFKKDPIIMKDFVTAMGSTKEANNLLNEISGAILSEWLPSGAVNKTAEGLLGTVGTVGAAFNPALAAGAVGAAASFSPRVVGKAARLAGKAAQKGITTGVRRAVTKEAARLNP